MSKSTISIEYLQYSDNGNLTELCSSEFLPGNSILTPSGNSYVDLSIRLTDTLNSIPLAEIVINVTSKPVSLTGPEWRNADALASRWPLTSNNKLKKRINEGTVRLHATLSASTISTNDQGLASVRCYAWHVCGNEGAPATDLITFSWGQGQIKEVKISSGVVLSEVPNDAAFSIIQKPGLTAKYAQTALCTRLRNSIGAKWNDLEEPFDASQYPLVITDASLRWGGLNPPHLTHRFGGTVDFRTPSTDGQPATVKTANYDRLATKYLIYLLQKSGSTEIRFADTLAGVTVDATHDNHLHVSWLAAPSEPWLHDGYN